MENSILLTSTALIFLAAAPLAQAQSSIGNNSLISSIERATGSNSDKATNTYDRLNPAFQGKNEQANDWATLPVDSTDLTAPEAGKAEATAPATTLAPASQLARKTQVNARPETTALGIGTSDPRGLLDVAGNGDTYLVHNPNVGSGQSLFVPGQVYLAPYSATTDVAYLQARRPNNTGSLALQLRTSHKGTSVDALRLNADGSAVFGGPITSQGFTVADRHLACGIRPLTGALAGVMALNGVRYAYYQNIADHALVGGEQIGLLAQELEKVFPALVSTDSDGFKAVNYAQLTPVLIEAIKDLATQNAALRQQVATQKEQATAASASVEQRLRALEANGPRASH